MVVVSPSTVRCGCISHLFWESATDFASDAAIRTRLSCYLFFWPLCEADLCQGLSAQTSSIADREIFPPTENQELALAVFCAPWFGGQTTDTAPTQDRLRSEPCCETLPTSFDNEEWLCMR